MPTRSPVFTLSVLLIVLLLQSSSALQVTSDAQNRRWLEWTTKRGRTYELQRSSNLRDLVIEDTWIGRGPCRTHALVTGSALRNTSSKPISHNDEDRFYKT